MSSEREAQAGEEPIELIELPSVPTPGRSDDWQRRPKTTVRRKPELCQVEVDCKDGCCQSPIPDRVKEKILWGDVKIDKQADKGPESDGADETNRLGPVHRVQFSDEVEIVETRDDADGGSRASEEERQVRKRQEGYSVKWQDLFTSRELDDMMACAANPSPSMATAWIKAKCDSRNRMAEDRKIEEDYNRQVEVDRRSLANAETMRPGNPSPIPGCLPGCEYILQSCLKHQLGCRGCLKHREYDIRTGRRLTEDEARPESTDLRHGGADEGSHGGKVKKQDSRAPPQEPKLCKVNPDVGCFHECTAEELFGKAKLISSSYAGQISESQRLCFFKEREGLLLSAADGWERVTLMVDSGASDTVIPPTVCRNAETHATAKVGIEYECANGRPLYNLGEKRCDAMLGNGKDIIGMAFQVVDVGRALLSVSRVCAQGHDVVFSEKKGSFIHLDGDPRKAVPLRNSGGVFELDVWMRPAGFVRQGS